MRRGKAGVDMVIYSHTRRRQNEAWRAVKEAVSAGDISGQRLNRSVKRVLSAKKKLGLLEAGPETVEEGSAPRQAARKARRWSRNIGRDSATLLSGEDDFVPLPERGKEGALVVFDFRRRIGPRREGSSKVDFLRDGLQEAGFSVEVAEEYRGEADLAAKPPALTGSSDWILLAVLAGFQGKDLDRFDFLPGAIKKWRRRGLSPVVLWAGNPYGAVGCANVETTVLVYDATVASLGAAVDVLRGTQKAEGKIPVCLPLSRGEDLT